MRRFVRAAAVTLLGTVVTVSAYSAAQPMALYATSNTDALAEAQQKKAELDAALADAKNLVDQLKKSKNSTAAKVKELEDELERTTAKAAEIEGQLSELNTEIAQSEEDLSEAEAKAAEQYGQMKRRMQYMYENGTNEYLEMLLTSQDITSFLNAAEYISMIVSYDRDKLEEYIATQEYIKSVKAGLESDYETLGVMKDAVNAERQTVSVLAQEKDAQLSELTADLSDAEKLQKEYEEEVKAQAEVLSGIQAAIAEEKRKAKEAAERKAAWEAEVAAQRAAAEAAGEEFVEPEYDEEAAAVSASTSGFIWPCPASHRITSDYGPRTSPTAGASTNHKGIDIGAPTGSSIIAVQSGTVVISKYSASAGNYVVVNHGADANGNIICSVYMHASERLVNVGDTVSQGQTIALVGSTGYSTGPHLHFAVTVNGDYVSPWGYVN